jgi:uncharacterized membrane protein
MGKSRLEALSDGVIAINIAIMVLELKVPRGESMDALPPLIPVCLIYVLSLALGFIKKFFRAESDAKIRSDCTST